MEIYSKELLLAIAKECQEFEHVIAAMGYGYSWVNVSPQNFLQKCDDCIYWQSGDCQIFQREIGK